MAEYLAKSLVYLPNVALGAQGVAKLALDGCESRLRVRPLVVVLQKLVAVVHEVPVHPRPNGIVRGLYRVALERDVGRPARTLDGLEVLRDK